MQNETQNQDTQAAPQQPVVEEAQAAPQQATDEAQAATSEVHDEPSIPQQEQEQGIAVGEGDPSSPGGEPVSEESPNPAEIPDPAVTLYPEDLSGPETAENTSDFLAGDETDAPIDLEAMDSLGEVFVGDEISPTVSEDDFDLLDDLFGNDVISPTVSEDDWDTMDWDDSNYGDAGPGVLSEEEFDWGNGEPSDTEAVSTPTDKIEDPVPTDQAQPPDSEAAAPLSPEAVSMPHDMIVKPVPTDQGEELPGDSGAEGEDATPGGYDDMLGISKEDIEGPSSDTDGDGASDLDETREDAAPGGYDGSGIAGGLDLDQDGVFDQIENNPEMSDENYTYDEGAYEDAEDAFEDLQDALQDGDEEDLAEALEELQGYLGGFDKGAEEEDPDPTGADTEEVPSTVDKEAVDAPDASGAAVSGPAVGANAQEDPKDLGEGVMEDDGEGGINPADVDYQEVLHDLDSGNLDEVRDFIKGLAGGNGEEESQDAPGAGHEHGHLADEGISLGDIVGEKDDYAYDEDAYKDAEDAMKDLQHALKHGDEEDRTEALQKLQGYLGGFDKGAEEEAQVGTETQDDKIPSVSEEDSDGDFWDFDDNGIDDFKEDKDGDGVSDLEDWDSNNDGVEDWMALDYNSNGIEDGKEDSDGDGQYDWQDSDSNGDGVDDLEAILGSDYSGVIIDDVASGNGIDTKEHSTGDGAAVSGPAVGAAGAAVGAGAAAGAGAVDQAIDAATEQAGGAIDDALGIDGAGSVIDNIANGNFDGALDGAAGQAGDAIDGALGIEGSGKVLDDVANGNFDEAYDAAVDYGADKAGDWIGEQLGSEELGDTASEVFNHVANGDFEEAFDTAVDGIGDAAEDLWDSIF